MTTPEATLPAEGRLKESAHALGFDVARIARADAAWDAGDRLSDFVSQGFHGDMGWMAETLERRRHPTTCGPTQNLRWSSASTTDPNTIRSNRLTRPEHATISVYAQNVDYHDLMKRKLKQLASSFATSTGNDVKIFVDTAPLMEKPLAHRAGLGWQGKHTNLVSREHGSWLFLGVMLTTADLTPNTAQRTPAAHAALASTSARHRLSRRPTRSMPGAAFPISPSKRRGRSPANSARPWATASMAATIASPSARGTSSPRPPARLPFIRAAELDRPASGRSGESR